VKKRKKHLTKIKMPIIMKSGIKCVPKNL